jgi:hypothetical protein
VSGAALPEVRIGDAVRCVEIAQHADGFAEMDEVIEERV